MSDVTSSQRHEHQRVTQRSRAARHLAVLTNRQVRAVFVRWLVVTLALWTAVLLPAVAYPNAAINEFLPLVVFVAGCAWTMWFGARLARHGRHNRVIRCSLWASIALAIWSVILILTASKTPGIVVDVGTYFGVVVIFWFLGFAVLVSLMGSGSLLVRLKTDPRGVEIGRSTHQHVAGSSESHAPGTYNVPPTSSLSTTEDSSSLDVIE